MSWDQIICAAPPEVDETLLLEGTIPARLVGGTYLLNGPALLHEHGIRLHPFDGHGLLRRMHFSSDKVTFKSRYIQTKAYVKEQKKGRIVYRGIGGLPYDSSVKNCLSSPFKNPANTSVYPWKGQLLCGYEGGWPHAVDSQTLDYHGLESLDGALKGMTSALAHTRYDAQRKERFFVCFEPSKHTKYRVLGFNEKGEKILHTDHKQFGMTLIHDFLITPSYVIILENPMIPDIPTLLKSFVGLNSLISAIKQHERPARLMLFPRSGGEPRVIELDRSYVAFHHAMAEENVDEAGNVESVSITSCLFDSYTDFGQEFGYRGHSQPYHDRFDHHPAQRLTKITVNLNTEHQTNDVLSEWGIDFPTIHPLHDGLSSTHIYGAAAAPKGTFNPFDTLCRVDTKTGTTETWTADGWNVGEPYFIPDDTDETEGTILSMLYRADKTQLAIFEASEMSKGPTARLTLPAVFPYGFHGTFLPATA